MNRRLGGDASLNAPIREDGDFGERTDRPGRRQRQPGEPARRIEQSDNRHKALGEASRCSTTASAGSFSPPPDRSAAHARGTCRGIQCIGASVLRDRNARVREGSESGAAKGCDHANAGMTSNARRHRGRRLCQCRELMENAMLSMHVGWGEGLRSDGDSMVDDRGLWTLSGTEIARYQKPGMSRCPDCSSLRMTRRRRTRLRPSLPSAALT